MLDRFSSLFPSPRSIKPAQGSYALSGSLGLTMPDGWRAGTVPEVSALGTAVTALPMGRTTIVVREGEIAESPSRDAYKLSITVDGITITARAAAGAQYGLRTLLKLIADGSIPCCEITDWPHIKQRGVQFDLGRVIERPEVIERLIPLYASLNYNVLQFYVEDALVFPSHPKLARPYAWTIDQMAKVVDLAGRYGMTAIPAIQSLGHCDWLTKHPEYAELDEKRGERRSGVLCPSHPRTQQLLHDIINDLAPLATAGIIHVGMDEAPVIGQCELCQPLHHKVGEAGVFADHANRMAGYAAEVGKRLGIWGDMFQYFPDSVSMLDKSIIVFGWYYYTFDKYPKVDIFENEPFDLIGLLQQHGIEAWGCPSSFYTAIMPYCLPHESLINARDWARYIHEKDEQGVMVTQWELTRSCVDLPMPVEGAIAAYLWDDKLDAPTSELLAQSCNSLYGCPQLAPLLEEIGKYRFHGHCTRRWMNADKLAQMATYEDPAPDMALATRFDTVAEEIAALATTAKHPEMVAAFVPAANWLAFQYRKRSLINQSALLIADGKYAEAAEKMSLLQQNAAELAEAWQADWLRNRYEGDNAQMAGRLRGEAEMFDKEVAALREAVKTSSYAGELGNPVLSVQLVDSYGTCCYLGVETSSDGKEFKDTGGAWVLQFDSEAMAGRHAAEMNYTFPLEKLEEARFVRVKAIGTGRFDLRAITLHYARERWGVKAVQSEGPVGGAEKLLAGELLTLGCKNCKQLFLEKMAEGNSGAAFGAEHGALTAELAPVTSPVA